MLAHRPMWLLCSVSKGKFVPNAFNVALRSKSSSVKRVKLRSEKAQARHFVDFKQVRVVGGSGGNGCSSFMSLFGNEWAGPDGGDGGHGGHVIFEADTGVSSLSAVASTLIGQNGEKGHSKHCTGKNAQHNVIKVPIGTFFRDSSSQVVADLAKQKDFFIAARGGAGGKGNYFFLSNENRAPTTYEEGGVGEDRVLYAELRVIAHFGMVGFPNAGKSSLLRAISRATPKVASYPFTTLYPHLGIIEYDDYEQVAVADIPGLLRGANLNYGLGFSFLRHIERCRNILFVIDLSLDNSWQQLEDLRYELDQYEAGLSNRPHVVVANKIDLPMAERNLRELEKFVGNQSKILPVSAKRKINIDQLVSYIRDMHDNSLESASINSAS